MKEKGCVYILKDRKNRFYVGSTNNLGRRMKQHKYGHTATTHRMEQLELVLVKEYETLEKARIIERKIKKLKRKDYIEKMIKDGDIKLKD